MDEDHLPKIDGVPFEVVKCKALTDNLDAPGKPLTVAQLERARGELLAKFDPETIWGQLQRHSVDRLVDCLVVNGNFRTCRCITSEIPVMLSYIEYSAIVTSTPGLGASQLGLSESDFAKLVGITWSARDQCVVK